MGIGSTLPTFCAGHWPLHCHPCHWPLHCRPFPTTVDCSLLNCAKEIFHLLNCSLLEFHDGQVTNTQLNLLLKSGVAAYVWVPALEVLPSTCHSGQLYSSYTLQAATQRDPGKPSDSISEHVATWKSLLPYRGRASALTPCSFNHLFVCLFSRLFSHPEPS